VSEEGDGQPLERRTRINFEKIQRSSGLGALRLSALLRQPISIAASALVLSAITLVFLVTLVCRGGAAAFAGQLLSEMSLWNGYLWPVWYFIGIGIVFKLIKNTKVITKSIKEALPGALYLPVVVLLPATWSPAHPSSSRDERKRRRLFMARPRAGR